MASSWLDVTVMEVPALMWMWVSGKPNVGKAENKSASAEKRAIVYILEPDDGGLGGRFY